MEHAVRDVAGRVAFITGGASGIGWGMARAFMDAGMKVVVADLLQQHLDEAAAQFPGKNNLHFIRVDVTDRAGMERAAEETERVFGKVHVLCNNVGVASRGDIDVATHEDWDYVIDVNIKGTANGLVSFLPRIKRHGEGGHIVNTSSMAGMIPVPAFVGTYSTAKFAIRGMSESLRLALGPHRIGVSVLCPGLVATRAMTGSAVYRQIHDGKPPEATPPPITGGMDPLAVGERVLKAIHDNELYIFPHGEFRDEVADYFARMLEAFPGEQDVDPERREMEARRAKSTDEMRLAADSIEN
jgi:NAD(P)-dependent dehydrogenase (short-subunit alcohol dehydrogenase family)